MSHDFRYMAKEAFARAKNELASGESERLKYAALELRLAMEAITYSRAEAFKAEMPPEEYATWQPRKLMQVLHDIDPTIGMTSTLRIGEQDNLGTPAPPERMRTMGTDFVFTLADLKAHYDAIGSYLHMPTLRKIQKGNSPDHDGLKARCDAAIAALEPVMSATIWNVTIGSFTVIECFNEDCRKPVRKRFPSRATVIEARCFECGAEYTVTSESDGRVLWEPVMEDVPCQTLGCQGKFSLWPNEVAPGTNWTCKECRQRWIIHLGISKYESGASET